MRQGDWKLVKLDVDPQLNGKIELYDLSADPTESNDVAAANPDVVAKLDAIARREHTPSPVFAFGAEKRTGAGAGVGGGKKPSTQPAAQSKDD